MSHFFYVTAFIVFIYIFDLLNINIKLYFLILCNGNFFFKRLIQKQNSVYLLNYDDDEW